MADICDNVCDLDDLTFSRLRATDDFSFEMGSWFRVTKYSVARLLGEIEATTLLLDHVNHAKALDVVTETWEDSCQRRLASVAEGRVTQIVGEPDGLGEVFVEMQSSGNSTGDLSYLKRVSQARTNVIAGRREKHLRLGLEPAKSPAMNDAITIALERSSNG